MRIEALNNYIETIGEALTLYECFFVIGYNKWSLSTVKGLQERMLSATPKSVCDEILSNSNGTADSIKQYLTIAKEKLQPYLVKIDVFKVYLLEDGGQEIDLLGDGGERENFLIDEVEGMPNNEIAITKEEAKEEAKEYVLRLSFILMDVNKKTQCLVEGFKELRKLAGMKTSMACEMQGLPTNLPKELDTDKAKELLHKAITAGLCDDTYKWLKSKALLAYFADKSSEHLGLCKGEYDGKPKTSWKPFEALFGISGLSGAKRDYQKTGTLPDGCSIVDKLF